MSALKRFLCAFAASAVFVCVLMVCCMDIGGAPLLRIDKDTDDLAERKTAQSHVFHNGELRGVWVPYFSIGGDGGMSESEFKTRFDSIVKTAKDHGINTLFVHVRSHCDAAYPSDIFPYSKIYLDHGKDPDYDPLGYMVKTAHGSGLEFHAWINPYRICDSGDIPENSPCKKWEGTRNVIEYDGGHYLNPASAQARSLIISGISEIVSRYDIDGIHLDDYFYAFTESSIDEEDYREYTDSVTKGVTPMSLEEWRRANVNVLVSGIYSIVKKADSNVLFGISPQGNTENDLAVGADVYEWCGNSGYIDYIAPQLYYNSENPVCPFESACDNWKKLVTNDSIRLYIGLALYKAGSDEDGGTWKSGDLIASQAEYARFCGADGFVLYSFDWLENEQTKQEMNALDEFIRSSKE